MSDLSHDDVADILAVLRAADFEHVDLQIGDVHLVASRHAPAGGLRAPEADRVAPAAASITASSSPAAPDPPDPRLPPSPAVPPPGARTIDAPMIGTFYRGPKPGEPPFVEAGQQVDPDTTVGLIEVMKMFTAVPAGAGGTILTCLVADGAFVEFGQPLFTLDGAGS